MSIVKLFILASTFLGSSQTSVEGRCNGSVSWTLVDGDGEVVGVEYNGNGPVSSAVVTQFNFSRLGSLNDQVHYAGENGVRVLDDGHRILLFPGGHAGQQVVHLFNYTSSSTITIDVYCQPLSLAYRQGTILGDCATNTTARLVPYFKLGVRNGKWTDVSRTGLYSNRLDTTNLTNAVILQYEDDYDPLATKLYFAEGTKLHEIDLGRQEVRTYHSPDGHQIYRLVPAVNSSFPVLRVTFYNDDDSRYSHQYFSSESGFMNDIFKTDYVAFSLFDLSYLVTFVNLNTLSIIKRDGTSQQFPLNITLDDPIRCHNVATAPIVHHLICLADDGLHPVVIDITDQVVSNKIIPVFDLQIVQVGMLTKDTFYMLTKDWEMLLYVVNSAVVYLGRYALRRNIDYVVTSATSNITCSNPTDEPDDVHTTESGLHLGIIFAISFAVLILLLLLLLLLLLSLVVFYKTFIQRSRSMDISSRHNKAMEKNPTHGENPVALDDFNTNCKDKTSHDDDTSTTPLSVVEDYGHTSSTYSAIQHEPSAEDTNNERFIEMNPRQVTSDSVTEIEALVEPQRNPYIISFKSSAKVDEFLEPGSSEPELFVEDSSVKVPVESTNNQPSPRLHQMLKDEII